jgi:hypothetical protein
MLIEALKKNLRITVRTTRFECTGNLHLHYKMSGKFGPRVITLSLTGSLLILFLNANFFVRSGRHAT